LLKSQWIARKSAKNCANTKVRRVDLRKKVKRNMSSDKMQKQRKWHETTKCAVRAEPKHQNVRATQR